MSIRNYRKEAPKVGDLVKITGTYLSKATRGTNLPVGRISKIIRLFKDQSEGLMLVVTDDDLVLTTGEFERSKLKFKTERTRLLYNSLLT